MKDKFTRKAFREGYLARSVYKLKDIQKKYNIIRKNDKILDLGASPGSWSQYSKELGGIVTSLDMDPINVKEIKKIKIDIFDKEIFKKLDKNYDLILSDLSPKTTGIPNLDNENCYDLNVRALFITKKILKKGGFFLCKIFQSGFSNKFIKEIKKEFKFIKLIKPVGSRKKSKEMYVLGIKKN